MKPSNSLFGSNKRTLAGFAAALVALLVNAGLSYYNINELVEHDYWVGHTHEVLAKLSATVLALVNAETGQRGYLITGEQRYLEPYSKSVGELPSLLANLDSLTEDNPRQHELALKLSSLANQRAEALSAAIRIRQAKGLEASRDFISAGQGVRLMEQVRAVARELEKNEDRLMVERAASAQQAYQTAVVSSFAVAVLGVGMMCVAFLMINREFRERLHAEQALRIAHDELELRVQERTTDLRRANTELEHQVSERKHAEMLVRANEARTRLIIDTAHGGFVSMNELGQIVDWNRRGETVFGWTRDEVIGRSLAETLIPPLYREAHTHGLKNFLATGEGPVLNTRIEVSALHKDGHIFPVELAISPIETDGHWYFHAFVHDITERHNAKRTLEQFAERLQKSNRELEQFASVASHDLQEPLRKIQAFGDRLNLRSGDALDEQGRDYLSRMLASASRMRTLINDLLAFSRVTSKIQPFRVVSLGEILQEVLSDLENARDAAGGRVEVGPMISIEADPLQMRQLLQNLIGNALKFRRPEEPPVIHIECQVTGDDQQNDGRELWCELRISDNGIGFEETYLDRIFDLFQRLHGRQEYEGTGMGLAICRKIAERHGGSITATSTPGKGSTFIVQLPVRRAQPEVVEA